MISIIFHLLVLSIYSFIGCNCGSIFGYRYEFPVEQQITIEYKELLFMEETWERTMLVGKCYIIFCIILSFILLRKYKKKTSFNSSNRLLKSKPYED